MVSKEISSLQHPKIKDLVSLRRDKDIRTQRQEVVLIGKKMIEEISSKKPLKAIYSLAPQPHISAEERYSVTQPILEKITGLSTSDGLVAVAAMPAPGLPAKLNRLLILDQLSDPGNLGTLLRTALALNWDAIAMTPGTVDPFNDKALRASKGALFFLPFAHLSLPEIQEICRKSHLTPFIADLGGTNVENVAWPSSSALVLSNEGSGPSSMVEKWGQKIEIPMHNGVESLNVAVSGAILLYLMGHKS